jgi:hypothetical protein
MNITEITDPMPDVTNAMLLGGLSDDMYLLWMQLASLSYATRALFLGSAFYEIYGGDIIVTDTRPVPTTGAQGDGLSFIWGDVVQEIEEMSHNVTAALLTLQLGNMNAECFIDEQAVVYQYTSFALWAPYGVSLHSHVMISPLRLCPITFYRRPWALLYFHSLLLS